MKNYRALFSDPVEGDLLEEIRSSANKGMAIGDDRFKDEIELLTGRRLNPKKAGRHVDGVRTGIALNVYLTPFITFIMFVDFVQTHQAEHI